MLSNVSRVAARDSGRTLATIQDLFTALGEDDALYGTLKSMKGAHARPDCCTWQTIAHVWRHQKLSSCSNSLRTDRVPVQGPASTQKQVVFQEHRQGYRPHVHVVADAVQGPHVDGLDALERADDGGITQDVGGESQSREDFS